MSDTSVDAALSPETDPVAAESDTPGERMADPRVFPVPIRMAFQAIVDGTTGKVVMHEALARAPNGKSAAPILREITPDNRRDFDQKCQGAAITLAHRLGVSVPVMINILPDAITEPESDLENLVWIAEDVGIGPQSIILEMNESTTRAGIAHLKRICRAARRLGLNTAIDSFGAGIAGICRLSA